MKKFKDIIPLIKIELLLCIVAPICTAVLLSANIMQASDHFYMILAGLCCIIAYAMVKMLFSLKKHGLILKKEDLHQPMSIKYRGFILIIAVILPVVGLTVNNGFGGWRDGGILGDFSSIWFYLIAIANGLIMLVDIKDHKLSVLLFYLKIVGFTYITYFTVVFLPFMPLGLLGIIFYGLGLLVFIPATVFVVELLQILRDASRLKAKFKSGLIAAVILGIITIPAVLSASFIMDKMNFNKALSYLSAAESQEMPTVDITRLGATLTQMGNALETSRDDLWFIGNGMDTPIISKIYQQNMSSGYIISPDTTNRLNQIFFGTFDNQPINTGSSQISNVHLLSAGTSSEFDAKTGIYKTWVDLEISNDGDRSLAEYRTEFLLPDGCFIGDYYLYVGHERKQGILADKRAALITYNNIIRTPKDPGIIYYKSDNVIEFRVYPFDVKQVRKTGFLVWHSQDEVLTIDGQDIYLAAEKSISQPLDMPGISFIPAAYKSGLPPLERMPQYYFIIDASQNSPYQEHMKKAEAYINGASITNARIYAASYKVYAGDRGGVKCEGGFNLPLAMEMIFGEVEAGCFPVIIAVSDNINKAPAWQKNNIAKQFPESGFYYNLGYDLSLTPYAFADNKRLDIVYAPVFSQAVAYNSLAVADNGKSEIVISGNPGAYTDNEYQNAFILYGKSAAHNNDNNAQIELVRDSFRQRILTKYTSFTVLETVEQENSLLELQAIFLNNNGNDAPAVMMDEPGLALCLLMIFVVAFFVRKKSKLTTKNLDCEADR